jgi:uncharacterized protein
MNTEVEEYKEILDSEMFKALKNHKAHGKTNVMEHSILVAECGLKIIDKLKLKVNKDEYIKSALLHDLYFYDWHEAPKHIGLHGFTHSKTAADNAKEIFGVNDRVYANILSHMWPLNITKIPKTKEGFILCVADKICSLKETFGRI